jgi:competence protein ComEC
LKIILTILKNLLTNLHSILALLFAILISVSPSYLDSFYPYYYDNEQSYVIFIDVGQGDAMLLISKQKTLLIDTGADISTVYALDKYLPFNHKVIDVLILTHPHMDHIGGYYEISKRYEIKSVIVNPVCNVSSLWQKIKDLRGMFNKQESFSLGDFEIEIEFLKGNENGDCTNSWNGNYNDDSVVTTMKYKGKNIIVNMGDLETSGEELLMLGYQYSNVDILKAGHHCSKTSTSSDLLQTLSPSLIICSVGENNTYGHPSESVINRFKKGNYKYLLTYERGDIVIPLR